MKKISLIAILLIRTISSFAQKADSVIFKKAVKIIVQNKHSSTENFVIAGRALISSGFTIDKKDDQFGQITSAPIKVSFGEQVINLIIKDNEIIMSSNFKADTKIQMASWAKSESTYEPVKYSDKISSKRCFQNMQKLVGEMDTTLELYSE